MWKRDIEGMNRNYWCGNNSKTLKGHESLIKCGYSGGVRGSSFNYCLFRDKTTDFQGALISHPRVGYTDAALVAGIVIFFCAASFIVRENFDEMQSHGGVNIWTPDIRIRASCLPCGMIAMRCAACLPRLARWLFLANFVRKLKDIAWLSGSENNEGCVCSI